MRSVGIAYLLWLFTGLVGGHRFYCGRIGTGFIWFFTGGLLGIGWLVDVFLIPDMVDDANRESQAFFGGPRPYSAAPPGIPAPVATPMPPNNQPAAVAQGYRVVFCTQCGSPMQVPSTATGHAYGCPACHTVLEIPA